jgi:hypothetical protein
MPSLYFLYTSMFMHLYSEPSRLTKFTAPRSVTYLLSRKHPGGAGENRLSKLLVDFSARSVHNPLLGDFTMNGFRIGALLLLAIGLIGCQEPYVASVEIHDFQAALGPDGSLELKFFRNSELAEQTIVPSDRLGGANAVMNFCSGLSQLGPWCIVNCHINPGTNMVVAWNPETGVTYCCPGLTWGLICAPRHGVLATIFRPHFGTPADAPSTLYVNEVELAQLPPYGWLREKFSPGGIEFRGTSDRKELMQARLTFAGKWSPQNAEVYDVFYLYHTLQMPVAHTNIRGVHRVFFVADGKLVSSQTCGAEIVVQANKLLEKQDSGGLAPWSEAPKSIGK